VVASTRSKLRYLLVEPFKLFEGDLGAQNAVS